MAKLRPMDPQKVVQALKDAGCTVKIPDKGPHTTWNCPCGHHRVHTSRGGEKIIHLKTVHYLIKHLTCLPEGWLQ
jgi:predicted RNA binding protein YcfA (HicA-like mRNA interferase family)